MKIKYRYIAAMLVVIISIAITPACIDAAYRFRGYKAYGGEYIVIPLGLIVAMVILEAATGWDVYISKKRIEEKRRRFIRNLELRNQEWEHGEEKNSCKVQKAYTFRESGKKEAYRQRYIPSAAGKRSGRTS